MSKEEQSIGAKAVKVNKLPNAKEIVEQNEYKVADYDSKGGEE